MKKLLLFLCGIVVTLALAEAVLRALPLPDGLGAAEPSSEWPTRRLIPGQAATMSFGWDLQHVEHSRINAQGFAAPFDYRPGAAVGVVIGDSYVEGLSTDAEGRLSAQLARAAGMPAQSVYGFGVSGTALPHYLGMARIVGERYRPQWAVVIVVARDFVEGFAKEPGFYSWRDAPDPIEFTPARAHGHAADLGRNLALYRYARLSLKFSPTALFSSGFSSPLKPVCHPGRLSAADDRLLDRWVKQLADALHLPASRVALVFDADRSSYDRIAHLPPGCPTRDDVARAWLATHAARAGYKIVQAGPVFAGDWNRSHIPFDHAPLDRHWTARSNALIAAAAATALHLDNMSQTAETNTRP